MLDREGLPSTSLERKTRDANSRPTKTDLVGNDEEKQRLSEGLASGSIGEKDELLPKEKQEHQPSPTGSFTSGLMWMIINTLATIGIVFTNKAIFSDPSLKLAQLTFAAFHFLITYLTLFVLSRPSIALFTPRRIPLLDILPLSLTMSLNVILPNLSLAYSTVTFYQIARILLTPTVAALNYLLYHTTLPPRAILALIPACVGVGMIQTTSPLGILFALSGTLASSLYTVWISAFHRRLRASSMQLLFSQAPLSAVVLLYVIPFADTWPTSWASLPGSRWGLVLLSGGFAALINISQFFIVAQTGAVSSTVVGHVKTCAIVALGWLTSGRRVGDGSLVGVGVAVGGIIAYSVIMLQEKGRQEARLGGR